MKHAVLLSRLLLTLGLLLAASGLGGFWYTRGEAPTPLSSQQQELLGVEAQDFHAGFVLAGRDLLYGTGEAEPIYDDEGRIVCWRHSGHRSVHGVNTDTIIYAGFTNEELTLLLLPRDLFVGQGTGKINGVFARQGADGLRAAVSELLGVPVDYHAIINLDIFQRVVDALDGVEVEVPIRMYHRDCAAGLTIDLRPGLQRLDGVQASHFVRYRNMSRGDIDRIENVKTLSYALLERVRALHVRGVTRVPELLDAFFDDVETNVELSLVLGRILPALSRLEIRSAGTLPTVEVTRGGVAGMVVDPRTVESFLASTFGGRARAFSEAPQAPVLITNRSGNPLLEEWYVARLVALGTPAELITVRSSPPDGSPSRVVATTALWEEAAYYSSLLHLGRQQVDRMPGQGGSGIEIVLSRDAFAGAAGAPAPIGDAGGTGDDRAH